MRHLGRISPKDKLYRELSLITYIQSRPSFTRKELLSLHFCGPNRTNQIITHLHELGFTHISHFTSPPKGKGRETAHYSWGEGKDAEYTPRVVRPSRARKATPYHKNSIFNVWDSNPGINCLES